MSTCALSWTVRGGGVVATQLITPQNTPVNTMGGTECQFSLQHLILATELGLVLHLPTHCLNRRSINKGG